MKKILIIILLLITIDSISQEKDRYGFDYKKLREENIFLPTWNNIFNSTTMPSEIFDKLMLEYDYKMIDKQYIKNINDIFLSVKKADKGLSFNWVSINIDTSNIEDIFTEFYKETKEDVKIYNIKKGNKNIRLEIKNKGDLGGYLLIQFNSIK